MKNNANVLLFFAFLSFIVIGFIAGFIGVAWPSIRATFNLPLDGLGILLMANTIGHLLTSFNTGSIINRLGLGGFLVLCGTLTAVGLFGFVIAPNWYWLLFFSFVTGTGAAGIDTGLTFYVATAYSARIMNWLHACFGVGATIGPLVVTAVLASGRPWYLSYAFGSGIQIIVIVGFLATFQAWQNAHISQNGSSQPPTTHRATLRLAIVWLGILFFFLYSGIESTAGQWSYTLFTKSRHVALQPAGTWVSIYWASLTLGRIVFGYTADKIGIHRLVLSALSGLIVGAILYTLPFQLSGFFGLALMGFCLAPLFPTVMSEAPRFFGPDHAANAIGYQVAFAGLGVAVLPAISGILADHWTLEIFGPFLIIASLLMLLVYLRFTQTHTNRLADLASKL